MNQQKRPWKAIAIGALAGVLLTGTLVATTPAIASAPVNINKIWKKIKPKADKRYYTKPASNARYAPKPQVLRGALVLASTPTGGYAMTHIDFGVALSAAPTAHIIPAMGVVPVGCAGTPDAPSASPGHLCIFEEAASGFGTRLVCSAVNDCPGASRFGAFYFANSTTATGFMYGSWALGVGSSSTTPRLSHADIGGARGGPPGGRN